MKNQNNRRLQTILLATIVTIFLLGASISTFAQGVGAKYGTRDPRTCEDTKAPVRGAMTAALATKYVICSAEGVKSDYLYLVEGITTVQVGGGVPYNPRTYPYAQDIDTKALIYPFRAGAYKSYQCAALTATSENKGYNCNIYPYPNANGVCMKTTFGDWSCTLGYQDVDRSRIENNMPPPTEAKTGSRTPETKAGANENKSEDGLPPPDFSEMEKYFDISKIEYSAADRRLHFIGKMTEKINPLDFQIDFYDEDDVKVVSTGRYVNIASGDYEKVGDIAKYSFDLPPESKWKFVKRVVITRHIN